MKTKVTIRYFASIREALAVSSETLETAAPTLGALRDELILRSGVWAEALSRNRPVRMALNQKMSNEDTPIPQPKVNQTHQALNDSNDIEIAFFPPVTGG